MPESLNGAIYLVIGVCAGSRFIFHATHKSKATVFKTIEETTARIERMKGDKWVKRHHMDGGGEFFSEANKNWAKNKGIQLTCSAANTPEYNNLAESY